MKYQTCRYSDHAEARAGVLVAHSSYRQPDTYEYQYCYPNYAGKSCESPDEKDLHSTICGKI